MTSLHHEQSIMVLIDYSLYIVRDALWRGPLSAVTQEGEERDSLHCLVGGGGWGGIRYFQLEISMYRNFDISIYRNFLQLGQRDHLFPLDDLADSGQIYS